MSRSSSLFLLQTSNYNSIVGKKAIYQQWQIIMGRVANHILSSQLMDRSDFFPITEVKQIFVWQEAGKRYLLLNRTRSKILCRISLVYFSFFWKLFSITNRHTRVYEKVLVIFFKITEYLISHWMVYRQSKLDKHSLKCSI